MPRQRDSFIINWMTGSNREIIHERVVLYEPSTSSKGSSVDVRPDKSETDSSKFRYETVLDPVEPEPKPESESEISEFDKVDRIVYRCYTNMLYTCLEELSVLKRFCRRPIDPAWNAPLVYKSMEQLYGVFEDTYAMYIVDDMTKSLRDICVLFNILANSLLEIHTDGKFTVLEASTDILHRQIQEELQLIDDVKMMEKQKNYLKLCLILELAENKELLAKVSDDAYRSKLIYADELGFARSRVYYNNDWETARLEQKKWSVAKETQALEETINKCEQSIANETRVHYEIESYCTEYSKDLEEQIADWESRYETELEQDDSKLIYLRNEIEVLGIQHVDLKELYDRRCKEMEDWIDYRTKKEIADAIELKRNQAATKIQAWWRGQLYRRQWGPYRKKKKGKKGKKGGKKGAAPKKKK